MKDFAGKNIFLTGGSSGIGLAVGKLLAARGANLFIFARGQERLAQGLATIQDRARGKGQRFGAMALDVSDSAMVREVLAKALEQWGPPAVLINCAGFARPGLLAGLSPQQIQATLHTNLAGVIHTTSALLPHLASPGYIVNVSSLAGLLGLYGYSDYCAAKFGVVGFSEALRAELWDRGITVSVLCPPDTDTPGYHQENQGKPPELAAVSARAGLMSPDKTARALLAGMARQKFLIIPGVRPRLIVWAKRLFPSLVERTMRHDLKKTKRALNHKERA